MVYIFPLSFLFTRCQGLLLGQINGPEVIVTRSLILSRKDRKKDRVEVGYQDLALASTIADKFSELDDVRQNVVGWYHSHPHITAMPSHVDVKTQGQYQQLDVGFIGLIFSVFDKGRLEICAFQSRGSGSNVGDCQWATVEIPIVIAYDPPPTVSGSYNPAMYSDNSIALLSVLLNEDKQTFHSIATTATTSATSVAASTNSDMTRVLNVYQSSLLHLIDLQLSPTLAALRSRQQTLQRERDRLRHQLRRQKPLFVPSSSPPPDLSSRLSVLEAFTPLWAQSSRSLRAVFEGTLVSVQLLPPIWDCLSTASPHLLRVIPTPFERRHLTCCSSFSQLTMAASWSLILDDDPRLSAPILTMATTSSESDISADCRWEVAMVSGGGEAERSVFGFSILGPAPRSVAEGGEKRELQSQTLSEEDRRSLVKLFRTVLESSLSLR
jgi:BRCA1/BRCA2-containing complex subunit 3